MSGGDERFEVRLGPIRSPSGARRVTSFFKQVRRVAKRRARRIGSGQRAFVRQSYFHRRVIIKASISKMAGKGTGALRAHLGYVERDGTSHDGKRAELYGPENDDVYKGELLDRVQDDRHHFRFIISPEDASQMADLKAFTRDLVSQMESDLGTRLDWAAADHYDTNQPHTHLIVRGRRNDGTDLVIPREYISRGMRERAQELVSLELGPVTELEGRTRIARQVTEDRLTEIDRGLLRQADDGVVDLGAPVRRGQMWRRQLEKRRLAKLERFGLATRLGKGRWQLASTTESTLRGIGERGDITRATHRAMSEAGATRGAMSTTLFDPAGKHARPLTGKVIATGVADDVNDRAYIVLDGLDGRAAFVNIGSADRLAQFERGMVVTAMPGRREPRASDRTIMSIAARQDGRYSPALHMASDERARPEFVEAHVRRLEALRRTGHVTRHADGAWTIPSDYLDRAERYELEAAQTRPVAIEQVSGLSLANMRGAEGATWLDQDLRDRAPDPAPRGFGREVEDARKARLAFLTRQGLIRKDVSRLDDDVLTALRRRDLAAAGADLSRTLGKPYRPMPDSGRINGVYSKAIDRPSGRFAVVERAKDFTLVPWRDVIDRNLGKSISGTVRGQQISWTLTRGRAIS